MGKYLIQIFVLAIVCSCSDNKEKKGALKSQKEFETLDAAVVQPEQQSKEFTMEFTDKQGSKDTNGFYSGDTIYLKINYAKRNKVLGNDYTLGLIAKTNNITIKRLTGTTFQLVIDPNNPLETFHFSPYIYSDNILFTQAYHDTLDGFNKKSDGHSVGLTEYVFPIQDQHKGN